MTRLRNWASVAMVVSSVVLGGCIVHTNRHTFTPVASSEATSATTLEVKNLRPTETDANVLAGTWSGRFRDERQARITLTAHDGAVASTGSHHVPTDAFKDLPAAGHDGPVDFRLERRAGVLRFTGTASNGKGSGDARFERNEPYAKELADVTGEEVDVRHALRLMWNEVDVADARRMRDAGFKASIDELISLRFHGVSPDYVIALQSGGYRFSAADYRSLRFHGVDAEEAIAFRKAGYDLSARELTDLRFHGVRADYAATLRAAGYELSARELKDLRFHGVTADYAKQMRDAGYRLSVAELVKLRFHGVSADYAAALRRAGYAFGTDELVKLRFNGVTADYAVAAAGAPGDETLSADELIKLRFRGVDEATLRKLRQ